MTHSVTFCLLCNYFNPIVNRSSSPTFYQQQSFSMILELISAWILDQIATCTYTYEFELI